MSVAANAPVVAAAVMFALITSGAIFTCEVEVSSTLPAVQLAGGVVYQLHKSATSENCALYMDTGPGI